MLRFCVRSLVVFAVAAPLVFAAAACGGGDSDSNGSNDDGGSSGGSPSGGSAPTATATPIGGSVRPTNAAVTFETVDGTATLTQSGGTVQYSVTASGVGEGAHALYIILDGSGCEGANRIGPLTPLEAAADGTATVEGMLIGQLVDLVGGSLAIYEGETSGTGLVDCGLISATP